MSKSIAVLYYLFLFTSSSTEIFAQKSSEQLKKLSDASCDSIVRKSCISSQISYETALKEWKSVNEVNNWIRENFRYSMERAKQLAENSPTREKAGIYPPEEFFQTKEGVCIDLSRFAVETINIIDTSKHIQYLLIEFDPIIIDGSIIRKHWMAVYRDSLGYYFLADSKRPGIIVGPYNNVEEFIKEYQAFRERTIVSWLILENYEKRKKKKAIRQEKNNLN